MKSANQSVHTPIILVKNLLFKYFYSSKAILEWGKNAKWKFFDPESLLKENVHFWKKGVIKSILLFSVLLRFKLNKLSLFFKNFYLKVTIWNKNANHCKLTGPYAIIYLCLPILYGLCSFRFCMLAKMSSYVWFPQHL